MDDSLLLTIIILVTLAVSAFFSGMEMAFVSANKLSIELKKKQGSYRGRILSYFLQRPRRFIGTMLVGNNIALVIYGIAMAKALEPPIRDLIDSEVAVLLIQTIISTLLILITAEYLPKTFFPTNATWWLNFLAFPLALIYAVLWLPMIIVIGISEGVLSLFIKSPLPSDQVVFGRTDLDNLVKESTERAEEPEELENEVQIFQNALDFSKVKARDCMVPRPEIVALEVEDTIVELQEKFIETGFSKIPIYRDTIDNIIGFTHSFELFKHPESIKSILLPVSIVPETAPANKVLEEFIQQSRSIAIVVDEFGGTSGMMTIEDVVEEIFGEIEDEHDVEELVEEQLKDNEFMFSGRLEIDHLNEKYKLGVPEAEEYETLAGYIIHHTEDIPSANTEIKIADFHFTIMEVSHTRIERVKMVLKDVD
jgi:putative hemolysin